jgi:prepilin-type N-terminal cleavage/methylation domain-containing protein
MNGSLCAFFMKNRRSKNLLSARLISCNHSGFSLIELMVVVAILGILVSLTTSSYQKYQRKALQSEAKLALGSIYALEKSFYSEYGAYVFGVDAIGYAPEGQRRFYFHALCGSAGTWAGTITGFTSSYGSVYLSPANSPYTYANTFSSLAGGGSWFTQCATYGNDPQTFQAFTAGQLKNGGETDAWIITELKNLSNVNIGY